MSPDPVEALVTALLFEGYALYPYTPGATKNATPTPFGIVYPPAYAAGGDSTFDHLRLECLVRGGAGTPVTATVRFLQADGVRHQAVERRLEVEAPGTETFSFPPLSGSVRLAVEPVDGDLARVGVTVENLTAHGPEVRDRADALRLSLLSTHVLVRAEGTTFLSPLETGGRATSVNTFPVLAADDDRAVLGAAIVLPDHPQLAPESLGDLFDGTEIEEALLLHVQALSDAERREIAEQDPVVREMIARAESAAPDELLRLHGRLRMEGG